MAKLKIYTFPDVVLSQKAKPIARVEKTYYKLADDMLETMYHSPGIGLAANQVGILERIIVIDVDFDLLDEKEADPAHSSRGNASSSKNAEVYDSGLITNKNPRMLINPEIILQEGHRTFEEGCLSVPEYTAEVKRADKIKLQYQDIDGLTKTLMAEGLLATAIQHEIDHLEGKLFIDRLSSLKKDLAKKRLLKERVEREAEEAARFGSLMGGSSRGRK